MTDTYVGHNRGTVRGRIRNRWIVEVPDLNTVFHHEFLPGWVNQPDEPPWIHVGAEVWVTFLAGDASRPVIAPFPPRNRK